MLMKFVSLTCAFAVASIAAMAGSVEHVAIFRFTEKPGRYAVGLRVVYQYDYERIYRPATNDLGKPYEGERARPLQTLIWYPAETSNRNSMSVREYADLVTTETTFEHPFITEDDRQEIAALGASLDTRLWAVRDAKPVEGHFPVVIYAPSFSSVSWENADLCEYLATQGYVVLATPDMGATNRSMTLDLAGVDTQAQDISFLIGYAQTLPNTQMTRVAAVGYSWGGICNLFAAARDNRIKALIALDGSMRYFPGLVKQAGDVHLSTQCWTHVPLDFRVGCPVKIATTAGSVNRSLPKALKQKPPRLGLRRSRKTQFRSGLNRIGPLALGALVGLDGEAHFVPQLSGYELRVPIEQRPMQTAVR
jgi:pimeloyl-ACP methyl ester carboxylesterase